MRMKHLDEAVKVTSTNIMSYLELIRKGLGLRGKPSIKNGKDSSWQVKYGNKLTLLFKNVEDEKTVDTSLLVGFSLDGENFVAVPETVDTIKELYGFAQHIVKKLEKGKKVPGMKSAKAIIDGADVEGEDTIGLVVSAFGSKETVKFNSEGEELFAKYFGVDGDTFYKPNEYGYYETRVLKSYDKKGFGIEIRDDILKVGSDESIKSLKGMPKKVNTSLTIYAKGLKNTDGITKAVKYDFYISSDKDNITELPEFIGGDAFILNISSIGKMNLPKVVQGNYTFGEKNSYIETSLGDILPQTIHGEVIELTNINGLRSGNWSSEWSTLEISDFSGMTGKNMESIKELRIQLSKNFDTTELKKLRDYFPNLELLRVKGLKTTIGIPSGIEIRVFGDVLSDDVSIELQVRSDHDWKLDNYEFLEIMYDKTGDKKYLSDEEKELFVFEKESIMKLSDLTLKGIISEMETPQTTCEYLDSKGVDYVKTRTQDGAMFKLVKSSSEETANYLIQMDKECPNIKRQFKVTAKGNNLKVVIKESIMESIDNSFKAFFDELENYNLDYDVEDIKDGYEVRVYEYAGHLEDLRLDLYTSGVAKKYAMEILSKDTFNVVLAN